MSDTTPHTYDVAELDTVLSADALTALMRSTWTWDDRALRRDLAALLVDLDSARQIAADDDIPASLSDAVQAQAYGAGSAFVADVLGPKLIADTGNPLRARYLDMALDTTRFAKRAHEAAQRAVGDTTAYFDSRIRAIEYVPAADWTGLVRNRGAAGLGDAMRAIGRGVVDSPLFASLGLAWQALDAVTRCEEAARLGQRLLSGDVVGTLAAAEQTGSWDPALVRTRAQPTDNGWRLTGEKNYVPAADAAGVVLVIGRSVAGPSLFAVDAGSAGLVIAPHDVTDSSRPLFGATFSDTPATLLGIEGGGGRLMSQLIDRATTALAAEQVGLIEAAIITLHDGHGDADPRAADVAMAHAAAYASWRHAVSNPSPAASATAHIACSAAAVRATGIVAEILDLHESVASLVRRAQSASLLFGGPALSHERLLERLGI
ncbi:hypothetical protein [Mycobacterium sp.]|uniref:hypothetical protein n=1 Tax=Mycobacterium sp. TaxID=1785 RepID=UPI0012245CCA|nr:hypothetical protein [Mycobacterium sp.]TAM65168.1 MAG: hypothetical protein EPN51_20320 [Mycobacterium sp.]